MRAGIIQSSYVPWRGYFDFIDSVDVFVIYDDVQYPVGRSWRNRNQVKTRDGLKWLTVPVRKKSAKLAIDEISIGVGNKPWKTDHRRILEEALGSAPFYSDAIAIWNEATSCSDTSVSALNVRLIRFVCEYLSISTRIVMSRNLQVTGAKTERLINVLKEVGAITYLSGPSARDYIEEDLFRGRNIRLEYKTYDYEPYPQLWGEFVGTVTVLDLIANCGPHSRDYLKSRTPNEVAVP